MRILLVEDDQLLKHHISVSLREHGFQLDATDHAEEADYYLKEHNPDVAIVDLGLPGRSGKNIIVNWRKKSLDIPVIVLTARDSWKDKIDLLDAGADDYMTKPFHMGELVARLHALARRRCGFISQIIDFHPLQLNISKKELSIDGNIVKLTRFEYIILETLMKKAGQVVSKKEIMKNLYQLVDLYHKDGHTVDVVKGRLKRKLSKHYPYEVLVTVRGQGYRFDPPRLV